MNWHGIGRPRAVNGRSNKPRINVRVSPMIDDQARRVGEELGIEMYPDSLNVPVQ